MGNTDGQVYHATSSGLMWLLLYPQYPILPVAYIPLTGGGHLIWGNWFCLLAIEDATASLVPLCVKGMPTFLAVYSDICSFINAPPIV